MLRGPDRAASLTYYGVLALFPGLLAITSLLAIVGQGERAINALFEIVELEVTSGHDVAFAYALLRCGKPSEQYPEVDPRLRLTLGLRREGDQWVVAHEHHSFADTSVSPEAAEH